MKPLTLVKNKPDLAVERALEQESNTDDAEGSTLDLRGALRATGPLEALARAI